MTPHQRAIFEEHQRRRLEKERSQALCGRIIEELFDRQKTFWADPSKRKAVLGSRRAGKTEMWARILTVVAMQNPRTLSRIWSHARLRAKELLWDQFRFLHGRHGIQVETNETELSIRFPNEAIIRLVGADKDKEIQKKRGDKTIYEVLLEAQSWESALLEKTVEDVVSPSLFDLDGTVCLEGTPGAIRAGYWFNITGNNDLDRTWQCPHPKHSDWMCHRWTMLDNPHLLDARAKLEKEKQRKRWTDDNPTYVREYLGRWVDDTTALYYPFDVLRNTYEPGSVIPYGPGWNHTLGWDLGSRDDMALVVWGWHPDREDLYEVVSWKKPGASADEVMSVIDDWERRLGLCLIAQAADTGGGGKMYVEEVHRRYTRRFTAAKKTQKYEHAKLFGDDLRTGHIKLVRDGAYALEMAALLRDPDWNADDLKDDPNPPTEDPRCANHCCFVAGTRVLTHTGERAIEDVRVGDMVLTREGWRPVVKHAPTGIKPVINRLGLRGTPDHPIWAEGRGWVRLDEIRASDVVLYAWNQKQSSGADSHGDDTPPRSDGRIESTSSAQDRGARCGCIAASGSPCTEPSRAVTMCTTSTGTPATTTSATSPVCSDGSTSPSTAKSTTPRTLRSTLRHWLSLARQHLRGIAPKKGLSGIERTVAAPWQQDHYTTESASSAADRSSRKTPSPRCAAVAVTRSDGEIQEWMTKPALASSVAPSSWSTDTASKPSAEERALVYALTVEGCHEFFANGVLVSNCDAGLYSWREAYHFYRPTKEAPPPVRGTKEYIDAQVEQMMLNRHKTSFDKLDEEGIYGFGAEDY